MKKSRLNQEWHRNNPMPMKSTLSQRADWHLAHIKNCACRKDLPPTIRQELVDRGIDVVSLLKEALERGTDHQDSASS